MLSVSAGGCAGNLPESAVKIGCVVVACNLRYLGNAHPVAGKQILRQFNALGGNVAPG